MRENFEKALAITLKLEGGYSNDAADHGGKTMWGITHGEYDAYRRAHGQEPRDVRELTEAERDDIYRTKYWDAVHGDDLPAGLDLVAFDGAVNSGPSRGANWVNGALGLPLAGRINAAIIAEALKSRDNNRIIDGACDARAAFLRRIGVGSQRVFLRGWLSRVRTIRREAHEMCGTGDAGDVKAALTLGASGAEVRELQTRLRALGYPVGQIDGQFGPSTQRAVILFQAGNGLAGALGDWGAEYWTTLDTAKHIAPDERRAASESDLRAAGDKQLGTMTWYQRILAFFGLGSVLTGGLQSMPDTAAAITNALSPIQGLIAFVSGNLWMVVLAVVIVLLVIGRYIISAHVEAFRNGSYQGNIQETENAY